MRFVLVILALSAALCGLAACGDRSEENVVVEQANIGEAVANASANHGQAMNSTGSVDEINAPAKATPQPAAESAEEPEIARQPAPKASPQPEPDPHAGHDMENMANMAHH